jgi:small subunit ribosomal protein S21
MRRILLQRGGCIRVTKVRVKSDEPFEKALRRFKKKCNKEGLMQRLKEVQHFEKPSDQRRRRLAKAVARAILEEM